jgi:hypothetical protein
VQRICNERHSCIWRKGAEKLATTLNLTATLNFTTTLNFTARLSSVEFVSGIQSEYSSSLQSDSAGSGSKSGTSWIFRHRSLSIRFLRPGPKSGQSISDSIGSQGEPSGQGERR